MGRAWRWQRDSVEVKGEQQQHDQRQHDHLASGGETSTRLFISNVNRAQHEGNYICLLATRLETVTSTAAIVRVFDRSQVAVQPARLDLLAGRDGQFTCRGQVDSRLQASSTVAWYRDGQDQMKLTSGLTSAGTNEAVLAISTAQLADSGNYSCRINTFMDTVAGTVQLAVRTPTLPQVVGSRLERYEGQEVELPCTAAVDPALGSSASLTWYKGSSPLSGPATAAVSTVGQLEQHLKLQAVTPEDEGDYLCRVETSLEVVDIKHQLNVYRAPKEAAGGGGDVVAVVGRWAELTCTVEVDPRLAARVHISWSRDNSSLGLGRQSLLSDTGRSTEQTDHRRQYKSRLHRNYQRDRFSHSCLSGGG